LIALYAYAATSCLSAPANGVLSRMSRLPIQLGCSACAKATASAWSSSSSP
jgi:hypothetical protein